MATYFLAREYNLGVLVPVYAGFATQAALFEAEKLQTNKKTDIRK